MSRFADKVAVVTGAVQGIGAATARRLGEEGAAVVAFLAGDDASYVSGRTLYVNGGAR